MSGATTRSPWTSAYQSVASATAIPVPEPPPRAADVPVRKIVDERLVRPHDVDRQPALVGRGRFGHERVRALDEPAVERLEIAARAARQIREVGPPAVDVRVVDEKLGRVPERQEPALNLVRRPEAEQQVLVRRLGAVLPPHDVRTHAPEGVLGLDHVAPGAVHLAAVLVEHLLVAEDLPVRRSSRQGNGHEVLRVEPEPDLLPHLRHPVGREPLLPVGVVGEIRRGQARGGAGRVPLLDVLGALPAQRREGNDAGVEPDVPDLGDPAHGLAARLAADRHLVDPRAAQLLEPVEARDGTLGELRLRADHRDVAAVALVDRQREAVVATARDVPVAHVAKPVVHALAHVRRRPLDGRVRVEERLPELVDGDQPVVRDPPDQWRVAAPAVRVAVHVLPGFEQEARLGEPPDDLVGSVRRGEAVQPAVRVVEASGLVDGRQDGKLVDPAELEVLLTRAGSDVDDAAAFLERDLVPRDDAMLDLGARAEVVERPAVAQADELGSLGRAREASRPDSGRLRPTRRSHASRTRPRARLRPRRWQAASTASSSR